MERFRKLISQFHSLLSHSVQEDLSMKTLVIGEALDLHKLALPAGFTLCDVAGIAPQHYSKVVLRSTLFSLTQCSKHTFCYNAYHLQIGMRCHQLFSLCITRGTGLAQVGGPWWYLLVSLYERRTNNLRSYSVLKTRHVDDFFRRWSLVQICHNRRKSCLINSND